MTKADDSFHFATITEDSFEILHKNQDTLIGFEKSTSHLNGKAYEMRPSNILEGN